jgi:hypothetical protein
MSTPERQVMIPGELYEVLLVRARQRETSVGDLVITILHRATAPWLDARQDARVPRDDVLPPTRPLTR